MSTYSTDQKLYKITYPLVVHRHRNWLRFYWLKLASGVLISLILVQYFFGASVYNVKVINTSVQYLGMVKANSFTPSKQIETNQNKSVFDKLNFTTDTISQYLVNNSGILNETIDDPSIITLSPVKQKTAKLAVSTPSTMQPQRNNLEKCPIVPPVLVGPIKVWFDYPSMDQLSKLYPFLEAGGHGKPLNCLSRSRVAIVIPYRDREKHLRGFLHNMHSLLTKQQLDYTIIAVEQMPNQTFNRAKLMNVGFVEAMKLYDWQCFIFHDVDLYPEDDRNLYSCPEQPRHMSVAVDKFKYKLPYSELFGGISAIRTEHFRNLNGFSNDYWGWGGEDDDMATRVKVCGYRITRYPANIARYKMIKHLKESSNPINKCRYNLMYKTKRRYKVDGIANLNYKVLKFEFNPVYTRIKVDLLEKESKDKLRKEGLCK